MWYNSVLFLFILLRFCAADSFYDYKYGDRYINDGEKVSDWQASLFSTGRVSQRKCIDIPKNLTLCQNLRYNRMKIPNLLQHDSINEVIQQSKSWISLLGVHCHPDTQLFLCSLFSPVCLEKDNMRDIYPCRSLCEKVKNGCEETMSFYGYKWPKMVHCDKFPEESEEMCIRGPNRSTDSSMYKPDKFCQACNQPNTMEGLVHNYCRSSFIVKAKIKKSRIRGDNTIIYLKKKKRIIKGSLSKKEKKKLNPHISGGSTCTCGLLESNSTTKGSYIVMGNKTDSGEFALTFIAPWARDKSFRKAVKIMKQGIECDDDIIDLYSKTDSGKSKGKGKRKKGKGKKKKGKGKKKKGKGKRKNKKDRKKGKKDKNATKP